MLKLLSPLLIVNLRIPTSELPCQTPASHFRRHIRSLEEIQNVPIHIFHCSQSDMVFNLHCRQHSKVFPPAESWLVNSNFGRARPMQGDDDNGDDNNNLLQWISPSRTLQVSNESWRVRWLKIFFTNPSQRFLCSGNIFMLFWSPTWSITSGIRRTKTRDARS